MINAILLSFLLLLPASIYLRFDLLKKKKYAQYWKGQKQMLPIGAIVAAVFSYIAMPAIILPDFLLPFGTLLAINALVTIFRPMVVIKKNNKIIVPLPKTPLYVLGVLLLILIITPLVPLFQATSLHELTNGQYVNDTLAPVDMNTIRLVPQEAASWKADKVVGDLGYRAQLGMLDVSLVNDHLYWVAPFEFENIWKWLQYDTTPGYVRVDAENPDAQVFREETLALKYMPSSFFQQNLYRHVYQAFPFYRLSEFSFELDENNKAWWVVSATTPTVWQTGEEFVGVILVDPTDGAMQWYDAENIPTWVDRAFPEILAEQYNYWFGAYKHGFLNTLFSQRDIHVPTLKNGVVDVHAMRSEEGLVWFVGHTSPSTQDQSLTGFTTLHTRTGELKYYNSANGLFNDQAAIDNANSEVSNFQGYHGSQPLLYNMYGELTWVVPILSENNIIQRIALVHAQSGDIALGDSLQESQRTYRQLLQDKGKTQIAADDIIKVEDTIFRQNNEYFIVDSLPQILFKTKNPEVFVTQAGDLVIVEYSKESADIGGIVDVISYDNTALDISIDPSAAALDENKETSSVNSDTDSESENSNNSNKNAESLTDIE